MILIHFLKIEGFACHDAITLKITSFKPKHVHQIASDGLE